MSELLTVREVAEILRITERTVWRRVVDGTIPAIRLGPRVVRFERDDLESALTRGKRTPVPA
jgi:excisionase family DNA binding protein